MLKKQPALALALALAVLAYVTVVIVGERVFWDTRVLPKREQRAAIAIRDDVVPFQKWGSKTFTWQYLERYYDRAWYCTQSDSNAFEACFLDGLNEALDRYPAVDLFLLAHGNQFVTWVEDLPASQRIRIRLVYNTGCGDLDQGSRWLALGADSYVGHPGQSASPLFYVYFLRRWTRGAALEQAVDQSNQLMRSLLVRIDPFMPKAWSAATTYEQSRAQAVGGRRVHIGEAE